MIRKTQAVTLCLLILAAAAQSSGQSTDRFDIAITVDDLTAHGALPQGMTRAGIAKSYLETLKAHGVPQAWGFVNAVHIKEDPPSEAVLDLWRQAGFPLGNHTYSHMNLASAASLEAWEADAEAGEPTLKNHMQGQDWHYLRFPNLSAGSGDRAQQAMAWLKTKGYREADVSASFDDWAYTDTYARCVAKGDAESIATMKAQYLKGVDMGIVNLKAVSQKVYGRVIPQVLLTHIGGFSAVMLPEVMQRLDAAGAHYVTLEKAQADPAYAETGGGVLMSRTARSKGISLADIPMPPSASAVGEQLGKLCR